MIRKSQLFPMPMTGQPQLPSMESLDSREFGMPGMNPQPVSTVIRPLMGIGEILSDFGIEEYIVTHPDESPEEIAKKIWFAYGGDVDGIHAVPGRSGKREEKEVSYEEAIEELKRTENKRWERLPKKKSLPYTKSLSDKDDEEEGVTIADITNLEELKSIVKSCIFGVLLKNKTSGQGGPGGGGGLPPIF